MDTTAVKFNTGDALDTSDTGATDIVIGTESDAVTLEKSDNVPIPFNTKMAMRIYKLRLKQKNILLNKLQREEKAEKKRRAKRKQQKASRKANRKKNRK